MECAYITIKEIGVSKYSVKIEVDTDPMNPRRDYDNLGTLVCFHKRYNLGDEHEYNSADYDGWDEMEDAICKEGDLAIILPVFMYDHSGITIQVGPFSCLWDSGQIGFIFVTKKTIRGWFGVKRVTSGLLKKVDEYLRSEIAVYDAYLRGDAYGYVIEDAQEEHVDSCWGYYSRKECEDAAKESVAYLEGHDRDQHEKAVVRTIPCCQP